MILKSKAAYRLYKYHTVNNSYDLKIYTCYDSAIPYYISIGYCYQTDVSDIGDVRYIMRIKYS